MQRGVVALVKKTNKQKNSCSIIISNTDFQALMLKFSIPFLCKPHKYNPILKLLFLTASPENKKHSRAHPIYSFLKSYSVIFKK